MKRKLKILIVSETYPPDMNGAAIFTQRLAQDMGERDNDVMVIAPNFRFHDEVVKEGKNLQVFRVRTLSAKPVHPYFRVVDMMGLKNKMKKQIIAFKPDIIHIQNHFLLGNTAMKIAKSMNIPIMGTNHFMPDNLLQYIPAFIHDEAKKMMWRHFKRIYSKLDFITAPSQAAINMVKEKGLTNEMQVISNGIDLNKFKKMPKDKRLMERYDIPDKMPVLLFVGRLEVDKNIDLLLKAIHKIGDKSKFKVLIVGRGKNDKALQRLSKKLKLTDRVIFTGRVDDEDLEKMYSLADIYLATGSAELQGIAVMEAMTAGLPVLAINAIALPELVQDGVNGYLFEKKVNDLAEKIIKILKEKKNWGKMSANSLKIISGHDIKKSMDKFESLYGELVARHKRA